MKRKEEEGVLSVVNDMAKKDVMSLQLSFDPPRGVALQQARSGAVCLKRLPAVPTNNTLHEAVKGLEGWSHPGRSKSPYWQ